MSHTRCSVAFLVIAVAAAAIRTDISTGAQADQWAQAMAAFTEQDQKAPPAGGIVFVGSSSTSRANDWEAQLGILFTLPTR